MVHERLWSYLQNMITRMFWGQEQFGGGFCGAGMKKLPPRSAIKGGLRTVGTIESLLLLNEFHPRSMHFPPGDDGDDILTSLEDPDVLPLQDETMYEGPSLDETTVVGWSEPALRSDRMCWSLIGMSHTLAYELVRISPRRFLSLLFGVRFCETQSQRGPKKFGSLLTRTVSQSHEWFHKAKANMWNLPGCIRGLQSRLQGFTTPGA